MIDRIKIENDIAILQNYKKTDDIEAFFKYCSSIGIGKYILMDMFETRYILVDGNIKNVPSGEFGIVPQVQNDLVSEETIVPVESVDSENAEVSENIETETSVEIQTYSKEEYDKLKSERDELSNNFDEVSQKLKKYSVAIEYFDKIIEIARVEFDKELLDMKDEVNKIKAEKEGLEDKVAEYRNKLSEILKYL